MIHRLTRAVLWLCLLSSGAIAAHGAEMPGNHGAKSASTTPRRAGNAVEVTPVRGMARMVAKPSNTRAARQEAFDAIPFAQLDTSARARARAVLAKSSIFRRLPIMTVDCDPALFTFLVNHPHVIVSIWEALGISEVGLSRSGPETFTADDGLGTEGEVEFLYRGDNLYLIHAKGAYEGTLFANAVRGQCLLLLQTEATTQANGRPQVTCRLDAFISLENAGWEMLAKTFQPLVGSTADHNFKETTAFISSLSRAAELNYSGIHLLSKKLEQLSAAERSAFVQLTERLALQSALAEARTLEKPEAVRSEEAALAGPALIEPSVSNTTPRAPVTKRGSSSTRRPTTVRVQKR